MSEFVKVITISEEKEDRNKRIYKTITVESSAVREVTDPETGEIFMARARPKRTNINAYEQQYLDDAPHYLYDTEIGSRVFGGIVSKSVEPYTIPTSKGERVVERYTTFVEASSDDENFEDIVAKAFENAGHTIVATRLGVNRPKVVVKDEEESEAPDTEEKEEEDDDQESGSYQIPVTNGADDLDDEF